MLRLFLIFAFAACPALLQAQILNVSPVFPTSSDMVTIIYDATKGNAALVGQTQIYAHTGVITDQSSNPNDWRHVQGNWGTMDPNVQMTNLGNDMHQISYQINSFYGSGAEIVEQMAFVFRNSDGSIVGRAADGSDIFTPVYDGNTGLATAFITPDAPSTIVQLNDVIPIAAAASDSSSLKLFDNGSLVASANWDKFLNFNLTASTSGNHLVVFEADNGTDISRDSFIYVAVPNQTNMNAPAGTVDGGNYLSATSVRLQLYAPNKPQAFVIGDFNNWTPDVNYLMNKTNDGHFWIDLTGLNAGEEYGYQYLIDDNLRVADPYAELVLDKFNDEYIPAATYPNLKAYPTGKTSGVVSVMQPGRPAYNWQSSANFSPADNRSLVVYELLIRDFVARHDYETLIDTLDYLDRLGVNAIELMPINEFEGNESWGYNPSFHMALDKYYGTINDFKWFVDECHKRDIAVILDVVYNHAFSQSPLCQLYWDNVNFRPASDNPWLNPIARHDFNVGYDFNHEAQATKDWMDRVMEYWLTEFRVDGFRFDLSKGFTQNNTLGNTNAWGQYDASRVALIKRLSDVVWATKPSAKVILEHFAVNDEEKELANYGCIIWGKATDAYNEGTMGYVNNSNFTYGVSHKARGYGLHNLIGYAESHDEQRLMYKNLQFGNSAAGYNTKNLGTALDRMELAAAFFFPVPGPKMFWQFGEVGYDIDINQNGRTGNKPILWNYNNVQARKDVWEVYSKLINLKTTHPIFLTNNWNTAFNGATKSMHLTDPSMNMTVIGNFDVIPLDVNPNFQNTGWWYNYLTEDSLNVTNTTGLINLQPGEYRVYTSSNLNAPTSTNLVGGKEALLSIYPNPTSGKIQIEAKDAMQDVQIDLLTTDGTLVQRFHSGDLNAGSYKAFHIGAEVSNGLYFVTVRTNGKVGTTRLVLMR